MQLTDFEQEIVRRRTPDGDGKVQSCGAVARALGVSEYRVRTLEAKLRRRFGVKTFGGDARLNSSHHVTAGTAAAIGLLILTLATGCQFGFGGGVKEMGSGSDSSLIKLTGLDARGAEATGLDAGDESNEATQGSTTITGEGATVFNIQAVGGGAMTLMIAALGAGLFLARKKGGSTTEALDRVMNAVAEAKGEDGGNGIARAVHNAGCRAHPTRGHIHDGAEAIIRERLGLLKHAARQRG